MRTSHAAEATTTYAVLAVMTVITLLPFVSIVFASLNEPGTLVSGLAVPAHLSLDSFREAWTTASFGRLLWSSTKICLAVVPISIACATLAGYALGTMRVPGGDVDLRGLPARTHPAR